MTHDELREWNKRVKEAADKMDLEHKESLKHLEPAGVRALGELVAADILFTLDRMKEPSIMHQVLMSGTKEN